MHARRIERIHDIIVSNGDNSSIFGAASMQAARRVRIRDDDDWYASTTYKWYENICKSEVAIWPTAERSLKQYPLAYDKFNDMVYGAGASATGNDRDRISRCPREMATGQGKGNIAHTVTVTTLTDKVVLALFADWHNEMLYFIFREGAAPENHGLAKIEYDGSNLEVLRTWTVDPDYDLADDEIDTCRYPYDLFYSQDTVSGQIFYIEHEHVVSTAGTGEYFRTYSYIKKIGTDGSGVTTIIGPTGMTAWAANHTGVDRIGHIFSLDVLHAYDEETPKIVWTHDITRQFDSDYKVKTAEMDGSGTTTIIDFVTHPDITVDHGVVESGWWDHLAVSQKDHRIFVRTIASTGLSNVWLYRFDFDGGNFEKQNITNVPDDSFYDSSHFRFELSTDYETIGPDAVM